MQDHFKLPCLRIPIAYFVTMLPKSVDIRRAADMKRGSVEHMTVIYIYMNSGYEEEERKKSCLCLYPSNARTVINVQCAQTPMCASLTKLDLRQCLAKTTRREND